MAWEPHSLALQADASRAAIDIEYCPNCGGALKIIAAIEDTPAIVRILAHLGLPTRAPPRSPARQLEWRASGHLFQAA